MLLNTEALALLQMFQGARIELETVETRINHIVKELVQTRR